MKFRFRPVRAFLFIASLFTSTAALADDDDKLEEGKSEKASSLTANASATKAEEVASRAERREVRADEI